MEQTEFTTEIATHQAAFGMSLDDDQIAGLDAFYNLVLEHNPLLHLVGPCSAEEFAIRHVLESLLLLNYLPAKAAFADVGTGAGFPSIPCLIVRPQLRAFLIESKEKKSAFLQAAVAQLGLAENAEIINKQFSEIPRPKVSLVTCRALDRFAQHLPKLLKWSGDAAKVFFSGPALGEALDERKIVFQQNLIPMSERRFIFVIK